MEGAELSHIIDLSASEAAQWVYLMQNLKERQNEITIFENYWHS